MIVKLIRLFLIFCCLSVCSGTLAQTNYTEDSTFQAGIRQYLSGHYENARNTFYTVMEENRFDSRAPYYYALCLHKVGRFDKAKNAYQDVISRFPSSLSARYARQGLQALAHPSIESTPAMMELYKPPYKGSEQTAVRRNLHMLGKKGPIETVKPIKKTRGVKAGSNRGSH